MKDIYSNILESFEKNRFSVLATIISQTGSAPRGVGTHLLVLEDGSSIGTIGGGILEKSVIEEAQKVFTYRLPVRYVQSMSGIDVDQTDMLCGGDVEIFLEPVSPDNINHLHLFKNIMDVSRRGGSGLLATVLNIGMWQAGTIPKMFFRSNGERFGSLMNIRELEDSITERMNSILKENRPCTIICRDHEGNYLNVFLEPILSDPTVFIFGGGHVSAQVVPLAHRVGFKVVVIDDRAEFSNARNFPDADNVFNYPFEGVMHKLPVQESSYLVIVTRGHSHDKTVLAQALLTSAQYIGMIGSKRKNAIIYEKLLEEGFTQDDIKRVHAPIGIDISAETPEEIAISIIAELIKVRANS